MKSKLRTHSFYLRNNSEPEAMIEVRRKKLKKAGKVRGSQGQLLRDFIDTL